MSGYPIPDAALDDRLGWIGTAGGGKTYNAMGAVERLLRRKARVVNVDPLGVWWGLRLDAKGTAPSPFPVVIFGGAHGDLPLSENAGALIGETAATMAESCIIDLSQLGTKAAERRFMTAFLEAIYRNAGGSLFHLVMDEADLFAPQKPPKGDEILLNLMEQIVRRGRVKGFIPWLITQRPAVLNKNVLSQIDGLIAFKLVASHDRDALDAWIEGQADKEQGREIKGALPTKQVGQGIVWVPARGILESVTFPTKKTFDSSRAPKRGEKAAATASLKPLDLGALKNRLAKVEAETKANDPAALRAEIARLKKELKKQPTPGGKTAPDQKVIERAMADGYRAGQADGRGAIVNLIPQIATNAADIRKQMDRVIADLAAIQRPKAPKGSAAAIQRSAPAPMAKGTAPASTPRAVPPRGNGKDDGLTGPQRNLLGALAFWKALGNDQPTRAQACVIAGWSITAGHIGNVSASLKTAGLIDYPVKGSLTLTAQGDALAEDAGTGSVVERIKSVLTGPQGRVFDFLLEHPGTHSREAVCDALGWNIEAGHIGNVAASLKTMDVIAYPVKGSLALADWIEQ